MDDAAAWATASASASWIAIESAESVSSGRPAHELLERRPLHVLQHDVVEAVRLADVVDRLDVRVVEGRAQRRLALEAPPGGLARGEVGPQRLDHDRPAQPQVVGLERGRLAALAQRRRRSGSATACCRGRGSSSGAARHCSAGARPDSQPRPAAVRRREIPARLRTVLKVLVVGPDSLSGELAPTVLGRPDIDRVHVELGGRGARGRRAVAAAHGGGRPAARRGDRPRPRRCARTRGRGPPRSSGSTAPTRPDAETELRRRGRERRDPASRSTRSSGTGGSRSC